MTGALAARVNAVKQRLAGQNNPNWVLVPLLEVLEVTLSDGALETLRRIRKRLDDASRAWRPRWRQMRPLVIPTMVDSSGVTIVVPVRNHAVLTYNCLEAIVSHTPAGRYEVIVVDNASGPLTRRMLARVKGLSVIRLPSNAGFVDACNAGARDARAALILFLNNDTTVCPGWFDALVAPMARDPHVGAVGAKLVYPDGRLQEAGNIVWRDGSGWNYGRDQDAQAPEYSYVREVDYCSAACLMVRRDAFQRLGGFDCRYAPAYYEDTDLCFRLREHGYRVLYQPAARVVHIEGATAGTDPTAGVKAYQTRNRERFVANHRAALQSQLAADAAALRVARDRNRGARVLVVDWMAPQPDRDAGSVRMHGLLRILVDLGCRVTFLPDNLALAEPYVTDLQQRGVEVLYGPMSPLAFVTRHAAEFDTVLLCRAPIAAKYVHAVTQATPRPYLVFDTVDLHHLREERQATLDADPLLASQAEATRAIELGVARASDLVWVTSTHEAEILRVRAPGVAVSIVPTIHEIRTDVPPFRARRDLLFIGGFRHPPNEDAIVYFIEAIMPLVREGLPGVRLLVVGADLPARLAAHATADIIMVGHVREVAPLFDASRVSVAPLRYGAGVKGKIGQSLAWGLPVVTTPIGAEGMDLCHGEHLMIGSTPEAFAKGVIDVYGDEATWTRLLPWSRARAGAYGL